MSRKITVGTSVACLLLVGIGLVFFLRTESAPLAQDVTITLTDDGFSPAEVRIALHGTVTFRSERETPFWPASDLHPSHGLYSEFDPLRPLQQDEEWSFTFDRPGDWGFHDHLRSYFTGFIHVSDQ